MDVLDGLTLDQLRTLVIIAETGSFSAAARNLGRVQSSISQTVQSLERQLRLTIFDRSTKTPQLTEQGRAILASARDVLVRTADLQTQASAMAAGVEAELTIATDGVFPTAPLAASLRELEKLFPSLAVTLYTDVVGAAERRLHDGDAQLALYAFSMTNCGLEGQLIIDIEAAPVASADHPLVKLGRPLERRDLEQHTQLILSDGLSGPGIGNVGIVSSKVWRFADLARRLDFLLEGFGWGSMPLHSVGDHIAAGRLAVLPLVDRSLTITSIPIYAVHLRGQPPGIAGRWLIDDLVARLKGRDLCAEATTELKLRAVP
jgi:DNA-binding transcriptional LysR family regulator